jgi:two-component system, cell cycle response regulator
LTINLSIFDILGVIAAVFMLTISVVMLAMFVRLLLRWGSQSYKVVSLILIAVVITNGALVGALITGTHWSGMLQSFVSLFSFVLLQWSVYKFFFQTKREKEQIYFAISGGVVVLFLIGSFFTTDLLQIFLPSILLLISAALSYIWIYPQYKRQPIYLYGLIGIAIGTVIQLLYGFLDDILLLRISLLFSAFYYFSMFLIIFDRIVYVIQAINVKSKTDGLTGLLLKRDFIEKAQAAINHGEAIALIFADIDNFKTLNDTQGHQMGDVMLKFVSNIMKSTFDDVGFAGRYGGEEMVAIVTDPNANPSELAERFRAKIEEKSKEYAEGTPVTVSVGYSCYKTNILQAKEFITQADEAMYRAKKTGKNCVAAYED